MAEQRLSREEFDQRVLELGLPGNAERMDALYEDVQAVLQRVAALRDVDTTGVEPSGISPWGPGQAGGQA